MSTWLKLLPMELDSIEDNLLLEPDHSIRNDDIEVGEMSAICKKLFTLGRLLEKDASQSYLDSKYCPDKDRKLELQSKASELGTKSGVLKEIMWISIKDDFNLWRETIGIRMGFKVVISKPDDDMPQFLRGFLGGGQEQ